MTSRRKADNADQTRDSSAIAESIRAYLEDRQSRVVELEERQVGRCPKALNSNRYLHRDMEKEDRRPGWLTLP